MPSQPKSKTKPPGARPSLTSGSGLGEIAYFKAGSKELKKWRPGPVGGADSSYQVIDMFSGCGGMSLGFAALSRNTGAFHLIGAVDVNPISLRTYEENYKCPGVVQDIRGLAESPKNLQKFLKSLPGYSSTRPTILIGCAPCQGFSAHRKKNWDKVDTRNSLVEAFARVASYMKPEVIIMENVPEMLSGRYWPYFEAFKRIIEPFGYVIKQDIHNSAAQGVPQERFRAIIIAMRKDFSMPIERLTPSRFVTVREAFSGLPAVKVGEVSDGDPMHRCANHRKETIDVIKAVPRDGGSRPAGVGPKCLQGFKGFADVYGRLRWSKPSITITHYARNPASGRFVHPDQDRGLTMREAARLQSFPDGYMFTGPFDDVFRQIGEAVPPLMSLSVAACVLANLRGESDLSQDKKETLTKPVNDSFAGVIAGIKMKRR